MITDRNGKELRIGDRVRIIVEKHTYESTVTGFLQGGDEQYIKVSGVQVGGKWITLVGDWKVEKL